MRKESKEKQDVGRFILDKIKFKRGEKERQQLQKK